MPRPTGLGFDEVALSGLPPLCEIINTIELQAKPGQPSYKLAWVRMPSGNTQLFKLIPELPAPTRESTP